MASFLSLSRVGTSPLGRRIAAYTFLLGALVAVIATAIQLHRAYQQDVEYVADRRMALIETSFLDGLENSLWNLDLRQAQIQLAGLLQIPDIVYVELDAPPHAQMHVGSPPDPALASTRQFPLIHMLDSEQRKIGTLSVTASLAGPRARAWERLMELMLVTGAIVATVALGILFIVRRLVTNHLIQMADYAKTLHLRRLDKPLLLQRPAQHQPPDELDSVVNAINSMRISLINDLQAKNRLHAEFQRQNHEMRAILDHSPAAIYVKDLEGRYLLVNKEFCRVVDRSFHDVLGKTDRDLLSADSANAANANDAQIISTARPIEREEVLELADGPHTYISTKFPLFDEATGQMWGIGGVSTDITARQRLEEERLRSQARLRALVESLDDMVLEVDEAGICLNIWSRTWHGLKQPEGRYLPDICGAAAGNELLQLLKVALATGDPQILEFPMIHGHEPRWFSARISVIRTPLQERQSACILCRDITERKQAEERLQKLAHYDVLTGLPNRAFLQDFLHMLLANASRHQTRLAVLFIDLDRLKFVNDSLGHAVGDQLIQAAAERIKDCLREGDTVARQGGDEFILVLPNLNKNEEAIHVAGKILKKLIQPFMLGNHEIVITGSIGISFYPQDGTGAHQLIKNADSAMYAAKESGRNNYQVFTPDMSTDTSRRLLLQHGLRHALDRQEFSLYYQPQVDIRTGRIVGAEALIRWRNPEMGGISPDTFIPVAEETGLILPIGNWALQEACRQYCRWQEQGLPPFLLAVNLSSLQFRQRSLVQVISDALATTQMNPENLELELTEGTIMTYTETSIHTLQTLKAMGLKLSIDDFGTGYSSLSYLKRFPVDKLKIDQSFILNLSHDPEDAAIASAVIALAKSLGLKVIAEGVENEETFSFLRNHHCDQMQGFLFSKPVPADQFARLLAINAKTAANDPGQEEGIINL